MTAYWSWILTAVGVFGLYLAGRKSPWGWAVGIGAQVLWFAYAVTTRQWGFIVSCLAYGAVYVRNFRAWRAQPAEPPPADRTFPWKGGEVTVTEPMTEAEYEAIKARWQTLHGSNTNAHHVTRLCTEHGINEWACVFNPHTARIEHFKRPWPGCRIDFAGSSRHGVVDPLDKEQP